MMLNILIGIGEGIICLSTLGILFAGRCLCNFYRHEGRPDSVGAEIDADGEAFRCKR